MSCRKRQASEDRKLERFRGSDRGRDARSIVLLPLCEGGDRPLLADLDHHRTALSQESGHLSELPPGVGDTASDLRIPGAEMHDGFRRSWRAGRRQHLGPIFTHPSQARQRHRMGQGRLVENVYELLKDRIKRHGLLGIFTGDPGIFGHDGEATQAPDVRPQGQHARRARCQRSDDLGDDGDHTR
jgi:hypothetical protein